MSAAHYEQAAQAFAAGRHDDAELGFAAQLALDPAHLPSLVDYGVLSFVRGKPERAADLFERALAFLPDNLAIAANLGRALAACGRFVAAEKRWRAILAQAPKDVNANYELAKTLMAQARHDEAAGHFAAALAEARDPLRLQCWRGAINALNYLDTATPETVLAENARFAAAYTPQAAPAPFANPRDPGRRLRLGYITSDFYAHSVARNMLGLFECRNAGAFEIHVYAEIERPDAVTRRFRALSDNWTATDGMDDETLARRIRADGIDILVLVAGHFDRNRVTTLLRRAAPVQLSIYDVSTHGTPAIDGAVFDPVMLAGRGDRFVERTLRLRHTYVHPPIVDAPPVAEPPVRRNGYVTFGSANNPAKMSRGTFDLWAAAMRAVPGSRLRLKFMRAFDEPEMRALFAGRFAERGIAPARIDFVVDAIERAAHLEFYATVDVALDTFPFTGSTTTFEALWMGTPVLTLAGPTALRRWTAAILTRAGRAEWCAADEAEFVRLAGELAAAAPRQDRAGLRADVAGSALCDLRAQARGYERLYRAMWRRWCKLNVA
jgi:predicted O-linked N-acetylglucosamine transferase (SPINDLY family)